MPPAVAKAARPIRARMASEPPAQVVQRASSSAGPGRLPPACLRPEAAGSQARVRLRPFSFSPPYPFVDSRERGGRRGDRGAHGWSTRQREPDHAAGPVGVRRLHPVAVDEPEGLEPPQRPLDRGTAARPAEPMERSQGQHDALSRAQKSRAAMTRTSTGVSRGSAGDVVGQLGEGRGLASARAGRVHIKSASLGFPDETSCSGRLWLSRGESRNTGPVVFPYHRAFSFIPPPPPRHNPHGCPAYPPLFSRYSQRCSVAAPECLSWTAEALLSPCS